MNQPDLASLYEGRKAAFAASLQRVTTSISQISTGRLIIAVIFFVIIYFSIESRGLALVLPALVVFFIMMVKQHAKAFEEKIRLQNLVAINDQELRALKGNYEGLATGSEFIDLHHPYAHDLDLFGEGSLFQYSNRGNTMEGKKKFAACLTNHLPTTAEIEHQQRSIRELSSKIDFRQDIQAGGMEITESSKDRAQLQEWLKQPSILYQKEFFKYLLILVPVLTIGSVIAAFIVPIFESIAIVFVLLQWSFGGYYLKKINVFHDYISRKKNILEKYAHILQCVAKEKFESSQLQKLTEDAHEAAHEVRRLAALVNDMDARSNFPMAILMNSLFLYDIRCVYRLEKWKAVHASRLMIWLDTVSEIEVLSSWGTFAFNHPEFTFAKIHAALSVSAKSLGHPLINRQELVANDVFIGDNHRIQLITGANMAGKSTFLRSIGVNLVLALTGAPVCAEEFHCPIIHLRTGMRTADSLRDHQSYFFAELDRLKSIMDELRQDKPLLVLLDEILKGTNSTDKLTGSIAMVKQLLPHPCLSLIATHDLALGELEKSYPDAIKNFCFEANIENDQLFFDYKIKPGLAQKMNATFLMKKMGIIPE